MILYKKFIVTCEKKIPTQQEIDNWDNIKQVAIRSPEVVDNFKKHISEAIYNILEIKETWETLETTCFTWDSFIEEDEGFSQCFVLSED